MPTSNAELKADLDRVRETAATAAAHLEAHEAVCAERWRQTDEKIGEIKTDITSLRSDLKAEGAARDADRSKLVSAVWGLVVAVGALMLTAIGWMAVQLYTLEPVRVQAQAPAQTVVVAPK